MVVDIGHVSIVASIIFCMIFSAITVMPELYAKWRQSDNWVPINLPPRMLGDDYHYFSLLNHIHRKLLNTLYDTQFSSVELSANSRFQLLGFIFNLIPFHIGFVFFDRRISVVLVRFWNRFLLGISCILFSSILFTILGREPSTIELLLTITVYFIFFPGPIGFGIIESIALQICNSRAVYDRSTANDLTRAMYSETSAPLFLLSCSVLMAQLSDGQLMQGAFIDLLVLAMLFFLYLPVACVFASLLMLSFLGNEMFVYAAFCAVLTLFLCIFYIYSVHKDDIGKELFAHNDAGQFFAGGMRKILSAVVTFASGLVVVLLNVGMQQETVLLLYAGSVPFILTILLNKHQFSRFWDRAAIIPFQLITVVACLDLFFEYFGERELQIIVAVLLSLLCYFYFRQSQLLFSNGATLLPKYIGFKREIDPEVVESDKTKSRIIATSSTVLGGCLDLYSSDTPLLRNYSLQKNGYREHLKAICLNFQAIGMRYPTFEKLMIRNVGYSDWQPFRPIVGEGRLAQLAYAHTIQFISTNREFNAALTSEGMFGDNGWTSDFRTLLKSIWQGAERSDVQKDEDICILLPNARF